MHVQPGGPDDDSPPIDTLEMKKQRARPAFTGEQADAIGEALKAWPARLATKEGLQELRKDMKNKIQTLRKDMKRMRWQLTVSITLAASALVSIVNHLLA